MRLLTRNQTIQPMKPMVPAMTQANHLMVLRTPWKKMTKIQRHRNSSLGSNQKTTKKQGFYYSFVIVNYKKILLNK